MTPLFKKLNYKGQVTILVLHATTTVEPLLAEMEAFTTIVREYTVGTTVDFALVFVQQQQEIEDTIRLIGTALHGDATLWMCYPKQSSKHYSCDFNRDTSWASLGEYDLEGVRQVAIDEDWSALRFRKVQYIKSLKRDNKRALSKEGKQRTSK